MVFLNIFKIKIILFLAIIYFSGSFLNAMTQKVEELKKKLAQEPNDISYSNKILEDAIKSKDIEVLNFLISYYKNNYGLTVDSEIGAYAPRKRKNIKLAPEKSQPELMAKFKNAIETGNEQLIRDLIKQGADINYNYGYHQSGTADSPLGLAMGKITGSTIDVNDKKFNILKLLLNLGADPASNSLCAKIFLFTVFGMEMDNFEKIEKILEEHIRVPIELLKKADCIIRTTKALSEINLPKDLSDIVCEYLY